MLGAGVATGAIAPAGLVAGAVWAASGRVLESVVLARDTAPDSGGSISSFGAALSLAADGDIAFEASISGGTADGSGRAAFWAQLDHGEGNEGVFIATSGAEMLVALPGDAAPGGGTYQFVGGTVIANEPGTLVFFGSLGSEVGLFRDVAGTQTAIDDDGDVAFWAELAGGTSTAGLFGEEDGTVRAIALAGDPAPDTGGTFLASAPPSPATSR